MAPAAWDALLLAVHPMLDGQNCTLYTGVQVAKQTSGKEDRKAFTTRAKPSRWV